ncbi:CHAT domain-containing protein [Labrenzia sp. EL_195]|nr:CHAT domain-containing protein [Labrenzia sp. EL_195]
MEDLSEVSARFYRMLDRSEYQEAYLTAKQYVQRRFGQNRFSMEDVNSRDLAILREGADVCRLLGDLETSKYYLVCCQNIIDAFASLAKPGEFDRPRIGIVLLRAQIALDNNELDAALGFLIDVAPDLPKAAQALVSAEDFASFKKKFPWRNRGPDELFSLLCNVLARYSASFGWFGTADLFLEQSRRYVLKSSKTSSRTLAAIDLEQAKVLLQMGDMDRSQELILKHAQAVESDLLLTFVAHSLKMRYALLQGDMAEVKTSSFQVLNSALELASPKLAAIAVLNFGRWLAMVNRAEFALSLLEKYERQGRMRAVGSRQLAGEFRLLKSLILKTQQRLGDHADEGVARIYGEQLVEEEEDAVKAETFGFLEQEDFEATFNRTALIIKFHLLNGRQLEAKQLFHRLHLHVRQTDSPLIIGRFFFLSAIIALDRQETKAAIVSLELAHKYFEKHNLVLDGWQCLTRLAASYLILGENEKSSECSIKSEKLLKQAITNLPAEEADLFLVDKWAEGETSIKQLILQLELDEKSQGNILLRLVDKSLRAIRYIELIGAIIFRYTNRPSKSLSEHSAGEILVGGKAFRQFAYQLVSQSDNIARFYFVILTDQTLIIKIQRHGFEWRRSDLGRNQIRHLAKGWHEEAREWIRKFDGARFPDAKETSDSIAALAKKAASLSQWLGLDQLIDELPETVKTLEFYTDDVLNRFPFAALPFRKGYLVEKYAIKSAIRIDSKPHRETPSKSANVFAIPQGLDDGTDCFGELPNSLREISVVSDALTAQEVDVKRHPPAGMEVFTLSKSDLSAKLDQANLLHIACHGVFDTEHPVNSGLVVPTGQGRSFEILTIRDIATMEFLQLREVVLTACYSADALTLPGRWNVSLPEAFCMAGAENVIGFLWAVEDETATNLIEKYYLKRKQMGVGGAVREAQNWCLAQQVENMTSNQSFPVYHPFFWASLSCYSRT